jgi:hypothetical protein
MRVAFPRFVDLEARSGSVIRGIRRAIAARPPGSSAAQQQRHDVGNPRVLSWRFFSFVHERTLPMRPSTFDARGRLLRRTRRMARLLMYQQRVRK